MGDRTSGKINLIVNDVLEKVMMWNTTISDERQLYKIAMETLMEISEPTTVQDFNTYKQLFEQEFPLGTRSPRQCSG